ncbi:multidrug and toxin extrusion protein 1-like [Anneissia japonica]|uniref:multidrug and toxin extrusion protein 1-like n=1 Tax=Anneissia japonica TaxID=1529436 RepID=UPI001425894D|nr:multidrug and toxin extrusion protein 1-like [Anneissia japonica]
MYMQYSNQFMKGGVCALFVCILWLSTKDHLAKVFIDDPEIISLVSKVVPLCVVYSFFDFTGAVCNGGLRGAGHQKIGAIVGFISYYIICLPVGGYLMLKTDLGIIGLWSGITLGLMAQGSSLLIYMMKLDWDLEGHKAQVRAGAIKLECLSNSSILEGNEQSEMQQLNSERLDQIQADTNGTELRRSLSTDTSNHKLSMVDEVSEQETKETLMKAELSNEKTDIETVPHETDIRLARDDIRFLVCKRLSLFLVCLTIFIVGLSLGIFFQPSYCENFGKYDAVNITLNNEYMYYDDDCIQL